MRLAALLTSAAFLVACSTAESQTNALPNAPDQRPAFAGQTRAPAATPTPVRVETVASGLDGAWAMEFLPDGRMLVTEKAGRLRIVTGDAMIDVAGVPEVDDRGQGGLLDVALGPDFATDRLVYISYAEPRDGGNGTTLARGRLVEEGGKARLDEVQVLFRQLPSWDSTKHYGSRIVFTPDGKLYLTVGERSDPRPRVQAQDLNSHLGKVIRLNPDGTVPADNPFVGRADAKPEIWSYGHRNLQSATADGQGRLWTVEHGPKGGDELNRPEPGKNYGWPVITYGLDYSGRPIGDGITQHAGMEQPVYYWDPVIGPSGMAYYDQTLFAGWQGDLLVGGLVSQGIVRLELADDRVVGEERIDLGARIRDVKIGPDGAVYAVTDRGDGRILKLTPERPS